MRRPFFLSFVRQGKALGRERHWGAAPGPAGGNDSPRTPSVPPCGVSECGGRARISYGVRSRGGWADVTPGSEGPAGAVRTASSVQACAAAPACGGRPLIPQSGISGSEEGISRCFGWEDRVERAPVTGGKNDPGTVHFRRSIDGSWEYREDGEARIG